jgi:hypothetical protein
MKASSTQNVAQKLTAFGIKSYLLKTFMTLCVALSATTRHEVLSNLTTDHPTLSLPAHVLSPKPLPAAAECPQSLACISSGWNRVRRYALYIYYAAPWTCPFLDLTCSWLSLATVERRDESNTSDGCTDKLGLSLYFNSASSSCESEHVCYIKRNSVDTRGALKAFQARHIIWLCLPVSMHRRCKLEISAIISHNVSVTRSWDKQGVPPWEEVGTSSSRARRSE